MLRRQCCLWFAAGGRTMPIRRRHDTGPFQTHSCSFRGKNLLRMGPAPDPCHPFGINPCFGCWRNSSGTRNDRGLPGKMLWISAQSACPSTHSHSLYTMLPSPDFPKFQTGGTLPTVVWCHLTCACFLKSKHAAQCPACFCRSCDVHGCMHALSAFQQSVITAICRAAPAKWLQAWSAEPLAVQRRLFSVLFVQWPLLSTNPA